MSTGPEDDEKPETIVVRQGNILMILEEGEFCCVCKTHKDLMRFGMGNPDDPMVYTVCNPCFAEGEDGYSRFHNWFAGQIEEALASKPDEWRKNPDGTWTEIKPSGAS